VAAALVAALTAAGLALFARITGAQPVRHEIFDEAVVTRAGECMRIDLKFNFRMQYLRHFPAWSGPSVYVQVRPIAARVPPVREAIVPRGADARPLEGVSYDGEPGGIPIVVVDFSRPVAFAVSQAEDFGTISIRYDPSGTGGTCLQAPAPPGPN